jgi:nicotinamide-nucleotide amidase
MATNTPSAASDADLHKLAIQVGARLMESEWRLVSAESCTGGWIGKAVTDVGGSSNWYLGGVISYSNVLKERLLGVRHSTLQDHGAVSEPVAQQMAIGALETLGGHIAVAVTGIAGPGGGQPGKPVGTVWFGWAWYRDGEIETRMAMELFAGDREQIRRHTVARAFGEVLQIIA